MTTPRDLSDRDLELATVSLICLDPDDRTPADEARLDELRAECARRWPAPKEGS